MKLGVYVARQDGPTVVQTARNCERYGVDSLWHDESLWYRGTISLLAACAATTERLRLGVASVNPYTAHPSHFAMQYATLADLSQGRAVAALGSGVESWISQLGMTWRLPRTSVKEAIEIARGLLNGDTVTYAGQVFTLDEVQMGAPPHFRTPLFWGAMGDRSIETAGAVADGWVVSAMEPAGYVERGMAVLAEGAAAAGRDHRAMEVVQYQVFACDPDAAVAVAQAKDLIALLFRLEFDFCVGQESLMKALSADLDGISTADYARVMQRLADGVPPDTAIPDELVAQTAIAGTPEQCAEQLQRFEALGVTETGLLSATFHVEDTARLVGEQLKPLMDTIPAGHR